MRKLFGSWILVLAVTVTLASAHAASLDQATLAKSVINGYIVPGYQQLAKAVTELETTLNAFCNKPDAGQLKVVRDAFRKAVIARAHVEYIRFGPVIEKNRFERLAFWPDPKGIGRRQVRRALQKRKANIDDPTALAKMSVALQGLTALEVVLYSKNADARLLATDDKLPCRYAAAIAANLKTLVQSIVDDWTKPGGFADVMTTPGPDNPAFLTQSEVTLEITQMIISGLAFVRDRKIERPVGLEDGPRPKIVEYRQSKLGRTALKGNLDGIAALYQDGGVRNALKIVSPQRMERADVSLNAAYKILEAIENPLETAVTLEDDTTNLISLSLTISGLRSSMGKAISLAAGLSLGFNANDGD